MGIIPETHEVLTLASFSKLASLQSAYFVGFGWLLGMSIWVSFIGGIIAFRSLPRHMFGTLQHNTFPVYFTLSIGLSTGLLGAWTYTHPVVQERYTEPLLADVAQAYALAYVAAMQGLNYFVVGPLTSKVMFQRHRQEKEEGKEYKDASASDAMKALNKKFGMLHGVSSLANLGALIALIFHGLWVGHSGL